MNTTICKDDLIKLGYKNYTAVSIIRKAKTIMVQKGHPFYNNKRLGRVPKKIVEEEILGCQLDMEGHKVG